MQPAGGGPDWNEQGGQPGKGRKKAPAKSKDEDEDLLIDEDDAAEAKSRTGLGQRPAFAVLLDDAAARMTAAEISGLEARAAKAAEDRPKFDAWAREFYAKHVATCRKVINPIAAARVCSRRFVDFGLDDRLREFHEQLFAAADVPATLSQWKQTRAAELAAILKTAFFPA